MRTTLKRTTGKGKELKVTCLALVREHFHNSKKQIERFQELKHAKKCQELRNNLGPKMACWVLLGAFWAEIFSENGPNLPKNCFRLTQVSYYILVLTLVCGDY